MTTRIVGIDPGLTGAIAMLAVGHETDVRDLPVIEDRTTKWIDGGRLLGTLIELRGGREPLVVAVERVHAMPKNGAVGAFSQGMTLGSILAAVQCAGCRIEFVSPHQWKKDLGLVPVRGQKQTVTERKHAALSKARLLFPGAPLDLAKHHGRAEALLIAHWFVNHARPWKAAA